jgi:hypothetical protein
VAFFICEVGEDYLLFGLVFLLLAPTSLTGFFDKARHDDSNINRTHPTAIAATA